MRKYSNLLLALFKVYYFPSEDDVVKLHFWTTKNPIVQSYTILVRKLLRGCFSGLKYIFKMIASTFWGIPFYWDLKNASSLPKMSTIFGKNLTFFRILSILIKSLLESWICFDDIFYIVGTLYINWRTCKWYMCLLYLSPLLSMREWLSWSAKWNLNQSYLHIYFIILMLP